MKSNIKNKILVFIFAFISIIESIIFAVPNDNSMPNENEKNLHVNPNLPVELQAAQKKLIEQLAEHDEQVAAISNLTTFLELQEIANNVASMNNTIDNTSSNVFPNEKVANENNGSKVIYAPNMVDISDTSKNDKSKVIDTTNKTIISKNSGISDVLTTPNMSAGWKSDGLGNWYFYDFYTKQMVTGYFVIDNRIYFFENSHIGKRPYGQLYMNEKTVDGFTADADGVIIDFWG